MSETKEPELLPCPFCGGAGKYYYDTDVEDGGAFDITVNCATIFCPAHINEDCTGGMLPQNSFEEAADIWNRRVPDPAPQWTAEPPNEEGWYMAKFRDHKELCSKRVYNVDGIMKIGFNDSLVTIEQYAQFFQIYLWLKITIPPLPERKECDE